MSMIGNLRLVTPAELDALIDDPSTVHTFLHGDDEASVDPPEPGLSLCLEKSWHGLHFLLTLTAWGGEPPLDFIAHGGVELGDEDVGYGPARTFSSSQVARLSQALAPLTAETLKPRFDPVVMLKLDIYPAIWDRPVEEDDTFGYLMEHFVRLKAFIAEGASAGLGLIIYVD